MLPFLLLTVARQTKIAIGMRIQLGIGTSLCAVIGLIREYFGTRSYRAPASRKSQMFSLHLLAEEFRCSRRKDDSGTGCSF